jgi:adenylosuccinate synthase
VNLDALLDELADLESRGVATHNVLISNRAHILFPHHTRLDVREEEVRGDAPHGTTRQGIWPAYADKVARVGIRIGELLHPEVLAASLRYQVARTNRWLGSDGQRVDADALLERCARWRSAIEARIVDSHGLVQRALRSDKRILLEGHLGVMRDLDWGIYPYVTSSTCLPGGAAAGAGIPAAHLGRVIGVVKAYTTAVGAGPFPTELHDATADYIRKAGGEFGTTTGRPRRCGWFDAVAARFACEIAGFTELAIMKLDVLDGLDQVKICTAYRHRGQLLAGMPETAVLGAVEPVYETFDGWTLPRGAARIEDLPATARAFIDRIAAFVGAPVSMVGLGAKREEMVHVIPLAGAGR